MSTILLTYIQGNTKEGFHFVVDDQNTGDPVDLTNSTVTISAYQKIQNTVLFEGICTITDAVNGECEYVPVEGDMDIPGEYLVDLKIDFPDNTVVRSRGAEMIILQKAPGS